MARKKVKICLSKEDEAISFMLRIYPENSDTVEIIIKMYKVNRRFTTKMTVKYQFMYETTRTNTMTMKITSQVKRIKQIRLI